MENIGQKKKPCEEKKIFAPKMASENAFKKRGYHLWKSNFKVQDTTIKMRNDMFKFSEFLYTGCSLRYEIK